MSGGSEYTQTVSVCINRDQIAIIRRAYEIVGQTDNQIASGVVLSYIERCLAKPHLSIHSWAYVSSVDYEADDTRLELTLTEGQWRRIDDICTAKRMGRAKLIRWIIADTAVEVGYPR